MLPRELLESPIWDKDPHYLRFWNYLMLKAWWSETPVTRGGITISRGQLLKSYRTIRKECRYHENQAWREWSLAKINRMVTWFEDLASISTVQGCANTGPWTGALGSSSAQASYGRRRMSCLSKNQGMGVGRSRRPVSARMGLWARLSRVTTTSRSVMLTLPPTSRRWPKRVFAHAWR